MSGPFRDNIRKLVDRLDGCVAAVLMGFDGISVDTYARSGYDGALPDIQTLAMEFAHLIAQARRTLITSAYQLLQTIGAHPRPNTAATTATPAPAPATPAAPTP